MQVRRYNWIFLSLWILSKPILCEDAVSLFAPRLANVPGPSLSFEVLTPKTEKAEQPQPIFLSQASTAVSEAVTSVLRSDSNPQIAAGADVIFRMNQHFKNTKPHSFRLYPYATTQLSAHGLSPKDFETRLIQGKFSSPAEVLQFLKTEAALLPSDYLQGRKIADNKMRSVFGVADFQSIRQSYKSSSIGQRIHNALSLSPSEIISPERITRPSASTPSWTALGIIEAQVPRAIFISTRRQLRQWH